MLNSIQKLVILLTTTQQKIIFADTPWETSRNLLFVASVLQFLEGSNCLLYPLVYCRSVFVAIGFNKPVIPKDVVGYEYMEGYEDISTNPKDYEGTVFTWWVFNRQKLLCLLYDWYLGQSVLILGRGNSGLETAMAIYGSANFVHLVGRSRVRFSWETHYVGDIR